MNYLLKLYQKYSVKKICRKYGITNYTVNPDGTVDVKGSVNLSHKNLNRLPLKFGKVSGNFYCYNNQLTTLEGCPTSVGGGFYCSRNPLPEEIIDNPKAFLKQLNRDKIINELLTKTLPEI